MYSVGKKQIKIMLTTSITNFFKSSSNSSTAIKKTLLSVAITLTCLSPNVALAQNNYEIQRLLQLRENYKVQVENLQAKMGLYMLTNPKASAAVLASGLGIAGILEQNMDSTTKVVLTGMGILGANYCVDSNNFQHCATVAFDLTSYSVQLNNYNRRINSITRQINSLQR
jgi:hypothetical protein